MKVVTTHFGHGFMEKKSYLAKQFKFVLVVMNGINKEEPVNAIYWRRTSIKVLHQRLLNKLRIFGIDGYRLAWFGLHPSALTENKVIMNSSYLDQEGN